MEKSFLEPRNRPDHDKGYWLAITVKLSCVYVREGLKTTTPLQSGVVVNQGNFIVTWW
jgi:hypothetical protein